MQTAHDESDRVRKPRRPRGPRADRRLSRTILAFAALAFVQPCPALAQVPTTAFVDDSTLAAETLDQLDDLIQAGSLAEASRALQRLLDEEGDRLLAAPDDVSRFRPVRDAVHRALLARPELLATYLNQQTPEADRLLGAGRHHTTEQTRLLTGPGYEAALRVAQEQFEAAHFETAWRTISQLDTHPLADRRAADTLGLLGTIAAYLGRDVSPVIEWWSARAGVPAEPAAAASRPAGVSDGDLIALADPGPTTLEGVVPTPLNRAPLPAAASWASQGSRGLGQRTFWALPSVTEHAVYVNDGEAVVAFDRFTLRRLWHFPAPSSSRDIDAQDARRLRNRTRQIEDAATVTIHDGAVFAAMGIVVSGRREGDQRVVCLDADTGRRRWIVEPQRLAPELFGAGVRGPIVVDGDTVVLALRKNERSRRTVAIYLAGLDARTGALRWSRLVGSVGALPYQQQTRAAQALLAHRGVVVLVDEVGLTAAIGTAIGRPLWLRRSGGLPSGGDTTTPWAVHRPLAAGDDIITLTPDRRRALRLELTSGRVKRSRELDRIADPMYLLDAPGAESGRVAVVGVSGVLPLNPDTLAPLPDAVDVSGRFGPFTGRVLAAGDRLIAPVETGVVVIGPDGATEPIALDSTGNIAAASGQLLTTDDTFVRSYLVWDVAAEMLKGRIRANPDNPEPAVTFAELAYRAGRTDEVLPAVDAAIEAIDRAPTGEDTRHAADRLFDVTLGIVESAHERWFGASDPQRDLGTAADAITDPLVDRLGRLADSPAQRVAHLLTQGRQHEARGHDTDAASSYQRVLAEPRLMAAPWRGPRVSIRAELEAERRLHALVGRAGYGVYEPFDRLAADELAALAPAPSPADIERIAGRYPLSIEALSARLDVAHALREIGKTRGAILTGARALDRLRRLDNGGVHLDPALLGRAYGSQVITLAAENRLEEAASLVAELESRRPGAPLLDGDTPITTDGVVAEITRRLADRRTTARIGSALAVDPEPQLLRGYVLRPLARPEPGGVARARFDGVLVVSPPGGTLTWHTADTRDGPLVSAWSREIDRDPLLLRIDDVSAWVFWPDETGGWVERLGLDDGAPLWTSAPWGELIDGVSTPDDNDRAPARVRFLDPSGSRVRADELLITMDARTLILVERGGRAAAIDASTGKKLWAAPLPVSRVHDTDTAGGVLAVGGQGTDRLGEFGPILATLDPRTGETIHTDETIDSPIRWTRVNGSGDLIAGLNDRIVSVSPAEARVNWELRNPRIVETEDATLLAGGLTVRALDDSVWMIDLDTGRAGAAPLETRGRLNTADRIVVERVGDRVMLASTDGVCLFDRSGALVGVDAFTQPSSLLPAVAAESVIAVLKIERGRFGLGGTRYTVHLLDPGTARILESFAVQLFGEPTALVAMDGRLLVSAGEATLVLRAPAE